MLKNKMDVLDNKLLKASGYSDKVYYCGNASNQKLYTRLRGFMEGVGVKFPFNPACYLHDKGYSTKPSFKEKMEIDWVFLGNMLKIIKNYEGNYPKKRLICRAVTFYLLVLITTPFYSGEEY